MEAIMRAEEISVDFGGLKALRDVDLHLNEGEILGLIGPNGAGKTTLFSALSGYLRPTAGRVRLEGEEITLLPPDQRAHLGIARTFQIVKPFSNLSVLENVMVGSFLRHPARSRAQREAEAILEFVGLDDRAHLQASRLTLGGRKRLEIARALATRPRVLLLDEVVAGLNPKEAADTVELIRRIRERGVSVIAVEHIMQVIMGISDRIVVLDYGVKIAEGAPAEVAANPDVIKAYLGE